MTDRKQVEGGFIIAQEHLPGWCYVLTGPWSSRCAEVMSKESARFLRLNRTLGARFESLTFLRELRDLRGVEIYDSTVGMKDLAPLLELSRLELVGLQCKFRNIDFAECFPGLRLASFHWRPGSESVFRCRALAFLFMEGYPGVDLAPLATLVSLQRLHVNSKRLASAEGAAELAALEHLTFAYCSALKDIGALSGCKSLRVLELYACGKATAIPSLSALRRLQRLHIENGSEIASIQPLLGCEALKEVYLPGTKVADGDLAPLLSLRRLRRVAFPKSRAHSHSMDEINAALAGMTSK